MPSEHRRSTARPQGRSGSDERSEAARGESAQSTTRAGRLVQDAAPLPATRWSAPDRIGVVLRVPAAGVYLGADRGGRPVALPAVRPQPTRVGMLGGPAVASLLAYRLLAVGCQLTVVTPGAAQWRALQAKVGEPRLRLVDRPVHWPPSPAGAPGTPPGPQALIVTIPTALPRWLGDSAWCTVVHATDVPPADGEFWDAVDAILLTRPGYGAVLARRWRRADAAIVDDLRQGEIAVADHAGTRVVRLTPAGPEREVSGAR